MFVSNISGGHTLVLSLQPHTCTHISDSCIWTFSPVRLRGESAFKQWCKLCNPTRPQYVPNTQSAALSVRPQMRHQQHQNPICYLHYPMKQKSHFNSPMATFFQRLHICVKTSLKFNDAWLLEPTASEVNIWLIVEFRINLFSDSINKWNTGLLRDIIWTLEIYASFILFDCNELQLHKA